VAEPSPVRALNCPEGRPWSKFFKQIGASFLQKCAGLRLGRSRGRLLRAGIIPPAQSRKDVRDSPTWLPPLQVWNRGRGYRRKPLLQA